MTNIRSQLVAQLMIGLAMVLFTASVISIQIGDRSTFAGSELYQDVVDRWGAVGVAAAFAAGQALKNMLMWASARTMLGLRTHPWLRPRFADVRRLLVPAGDDGEGAA